MVLWSAVLVRSTIVFIRAVNIEAASIEINGINAQGGHLGPSNARISQYTEDGGVPTGMVRGLRDWTK